MKLTDTEIHSLQQAFSSIFDAKKVEEIAWETGFIKRSTNKIQPIDLLKLLSTEILNDPKSSYIELANTLYELNPNIEISPQALCQRIDSQQCENFFLALLNLALEVNAKAAVKHVDIENLKCFKRVLTEDSTSCQLHPKLSPFFKGSGNQNKGRSVLKINLVQDLLNSCIEKLDIVEGIQPDQGFSKEILKIVKEGDLIIRDLGYFSIQCFEMIQNALAFFLSRYNSVANIYLTEDSEEKIHLAKFFNKFHPGKNEIDINVFLGVRKMLIRLVAYRLPQEIVSRRRQALIEKAKRKGYKPSKEALENVAFSIYVTNVPSTIWDVKVVGTIYRIRWQVELFFKFWKSDLKIEYLQGKSVHRVLCLIYGRLIAVVLINITFATVALSVEKQRVRELSLLKFVKWFSNPKRLPQMVREMNILDLFSRCTDKILVSLCKQKRTRQTTQKQIDQEVGYLETLEHWITF